LRGRLHRKLLRLPYLRKAAHGCMLFGNETKVGEWDMQTPEEVYNSFAGEYEQSLDIPWMRFYEAATWENIKEFLPDKNDTVILDIGGGTGRWSLHLAKEGYRVVLGDISNKMLNVARDKLKEAGLSDLVDVQRLDICSMSGLAENSFDFILCQGDPLSYVTNPAKAAAECFRVAKPGAFFIPSVDCRFPWVTRMASLAEWNRASEIMETGASQMAYPTGSFPTHGFSPQELIDLLEGAGWEVGQIIGKTVLGALLPTETLKQFVNDPHTFHLLLQLEKQLGAEPSLIGIASHIETVCQKPDKDLDNNRDART